MKWLVKFILYGFAMFGPIASAHASSIRMFSLKDVGSSDVVSVITQDKRGLMYFLAGHHIYEFDGEKWQEILTDDKLEYTTISTDPNGRIYVGTKSNLGYIAPDEKGNLKFVSLAAKLDPTYLKSDWRVNAIWYSKDKVYFVTDRTILIYENDSFTIVGSSGRIETSFAAHDELFVIDKTQGLLKLTDLKLVPYCDANFFRANASYPKNNAVMLATKSSGLLIFNAEAKECAQAFDTLIEQDHDFFDQVMVTDMRMVDENYVTATLGYGLTFISSKGQILDQIKEYAGQPIGDVYAVYVDFKGAIWFSTRSGVGIFSKGGQDKSEEKIAEEAEKIPFAALIRKCQDLRNKETIFGGSFFKELGGVQTLDAQEGRTTRIPYAKNSVSFHFSSNAVDQSDVIEYQSILEGLDTDWSDWSKNDSRDFTNLFWKKYVFQVRARDPAGNVSKPSIFYFRVDPPWYESVWFYFFEVGVLVMLLMIAGIMKAMGSSIGDFISDKTITVLVSICFSLMLTKAGYYALISALAGEVAFVKLALSASLGLFIGPVQDRLKAAFTRLTIRVTAIVNRIKERYRIGKGAS